MPQFCRSRCDLSTDSFVVQVGRHDYGAVTVDAVNCFGSRTTLGRIGLWLLSGLLSDRDSSTLRLTHNESHVKELVLMRPWIAGFPDLRVQALSFKYIPDAVTRHPWRRGASEDLPFLEVVGSHGLAHPMDGVPRERLEGFGSIAASVLLAELLLNLSRPDNATLEVNLEGDFGFGGVAKRSAEISFHLPGSDAFGPWLKLST